MKAETKRKLWTAALVVVGAFGIGSLGYLLYKDGCEDGYDEGYKKGLFDGKGEDGVLQKYHEGVNDTVINTHRFLYDSYAYPESVTYVSSGVSLDKKMANDLINEEDRKKLDEELGEGWRARVVYVTKPKDYDEVRSLVSAMAQNRETPEETEEAEKPEELNETEESL